jgi:hypothetical protein
MLAMHSSGTPLPRLSPRLLHICSPPSTSVLLISFQAYYAHTTTAFKACLLPLASLPWYLPRRSST